MSKVISRKEFVTILGATAFAGALALTGCGSSSTSSSSNSKTITVAASPTPHAEILENAVKPLLKNQGYTLEVKEFTDYVQPNTVTEAGEVDANYFQHKPYLDNFNKEQGTHLVSVEAVHYEPFGVYAGKSNNINNIPDGAIIAVPNDATNEARALLLLQQAGIIKLRDGAGIEATPKDVVTNSHNINFKELESAVIPTILQDVDFACINGNYAAQANLSVNKDALVVEDASGEAAQTYANILVVKEGRESDEKIQALAKALVSDEVRSYINNTYDGAVRPIF